MQIGLDEIGVSTRVLGASFMSTMAQAAPRVDRLEISQAKCLTIAGLVAVLYGPVLSHLVLQWWQDPDYSHGFIVPLLVGYVLYQRRRKLRQIPLEPSNMGFPVMVGGVGVFLVGAFGGGFFC